MTRDILIIIISKSYRKTNVLLFYQINECLFVISINFGKILSESENHRSICYRSSE